MFKKALLFSFAGHLFCFSFFTIDYGISAQQSADKFNLAFLGSILQSADFQPAGPGRTKADRRILYVAKKRLSTAGLPKRTIKPQNQSGEVSFAKRLNKFLVNQPHSLPAGSSKEKEGYLTSRPAWERVDLELKIE